MSTEVSYLTGTVPLPPGVRVVAGDRRVEAKGPLGSAVRPFPTDLFRVEIRPESILLTLELPPERREARALLGTWVAHLKNLTLGVSRGVEAKMKVVAAHFPMKVQAKEGEIQIENFLGEKYPRSAPLVPGVTATVDGEFVVLSGVDVEQVGQSAANIERATRIRNYDPRVFQDGIYLIQRAHLKEAAQ
jgi:large subunit ribosomal protein L6